MTIGVSKELTKVSVEEEVTEGTFLAAQSDTSYVQPLSDGFEITGSKDTKERAILTEGFIKARPRVGKKSVEWTLNVEAKGSGIEGAAPDYDKVLRAMLGTRREVASRDSIVGLGSTTSNLEITSHGYQKGDIFVVLEPGAHHICAVKEVVDVDNVTIEPPMPSAPSDATEVSKVQVYHGSNAPSDYKTLSLAYYHGDEILEWASGCRPSSMALANFTTGELPNLEFSGSGVDFDRDDQSAPHTPNYDDEVPPLALASCVYIDGSEVPVNNFAFSVEHSNGELPATCAESGILSTRKTGKRGVTYNLDPYMDDADVSLFTKFKSNTPYSLFWFTANPGVVDGEYDLGSIMAAYMPACISSSDTVSDLDGINITEVEGNADGGSAGEEIEFFLGII